MNITPQQFEELNQKEKLAISIIGMSNIGKTFWAKRLAYIGFNHINCDDIIESRLESELRDLGYQGINDVSKWLGQPYDERFAVNQEKYLRHEADIIQETLHNLSDKLSGNIVIDTTGSIVHTSDVLCSDIKNKTLIIYLEADEQMEDQMLARYLEKPKPVVWGDVFKTCEGEAGSETLKKCYPKLLKYRSSLYKKYADVVIQTKQLNDQMGGKDFLEIVKNSL